MRVAIAQVNPTVGDLRGNRRLVEEAAAKAAAAKADLVVLPEMVLTGYPPMDLLERNGFVRDQLAELDALLPASERIPIVLGAVMPAEERRPRKLLNAAVLLADGELAAVRAKSLLPTYDVFDEKRYFRPAERREPVVLGAASSGSPSARTPGWRRWATRWIPSASSRPRARSSCSTSRRRRGTWRRPPRAAAWSPTWPPGTASRSSS